MTRHINAMASENEVSLPEELQFYFDNSWRIASTTDELRDIDDKLAPTLTETGWTLHRLSLPVEEQTLSILLYCSNSQYELVYCLQLFSLSGNIVKDSVRWFPYKP